MGRGGTAPWVCRFGDGVQCSFQTLFCPEVPPGLDGRMRWTAVGSFIRLILCTEESTFFQQRHRKSIMACERRRGETWGGWTRAKARTSSRPGFSTCIIIMAPR